MLFDRVYDNRRIEASKSLDETRNRRRVIDDTLNVIIDRMNKLKEEQKELREFLDLEKQRRCIEALLTCELSMAVCRVTSANS